MPVVARRRSGLLLEENLAHESNHFGDADLFEYAMDILVEDVFGMEEIFYNLGTTRFTYSTLCWFILRLLASDKSVSAKAYAVAMRSCSDRLGGKALGKGAPSQMAPDAVTRSCACGRYHVCMNKYGGQ